MSINNVLGSPEAFLDQIMFNLARDSIDVSNFPLDHICYRVENVISYSLLKGDLSSIGTLLTEAVIGGRPISTFRLQKPIIYKERNIWLVELPAPKQGKPFTEGYEHAEFVIDMQFQDFMALYSRVPFQTTGMHKERNPDIERSYDGVNVKFHYQPLDKVIEEEK
jgi:uncharacterized protein